MGPSLPKYKYLGTAAGEAGFQENLIIRDRLWAALGKIEPITQMVKAGTLSISQITQATAHIGGLVAERLKQRDQVVNSWWGLHKITPMDDYTKEALSVMDLADLSISEAELRIRKDMRSSADKSAEAVKEYEDSYKDKLLKLDTICTHVRGLRAWEDRVLETLNTLASQIMEEEVPAKAQDLLDRQKVNQTSITQMKSQRTTQITNFIRSVTGNNEWEHNPKHVLGSTIEFPEELEEQNQKIINVMKSYVSLNLYELYALVPAIERIHTQYNAESGTRWKPPEGPEYKDLKFNTRGTYSSQSSVLYDRIVASISTKYVNMSLNPFYYGMRKTELATVEVGDGVTLYWSILQRYGGGSYADVAILEQKVNNTFLEFISGFPDIIKICDETDVNLQKLALIQHPIKWVTSGQRIVQAIDSNPNLNGFSNLNVWLSLELTKFDENDCVCAMQQLMATIREIHNNNVNFDSLQGVNTTDPGQQANMTTGEHHQADANQGYGERKRLPPSMIKCRDDPNCTRRGCAFKHTKKPKYDKDRGHQLFQPKRHRKLGGKGGKGKGKGNDKPKQLRICMEEGCKVVAEKGKHRCSRCQMRLMVDEAVNARQAEAAEGANALTANKKRKGKGDATAHNASAKRAKAKSIIEKGCFQEGTSQLAESSDDDSDEGKESRHSRMKE
jgi:hypothetical protein